jgi:hypothetical protein
MSKIEKPVKKNSISGKKSVRILKTGFGDSMKSISRRF